MKARIVKGEFSDGSTWYKVQYKEWNWLPFWLDFRVETDGVAGARLLWALWFQTKELAWKNFIDNSPFFVDKEPKMLKKEIIETFSLKSHQKIW